MSENGTSSNHLYNKDVFDRVKVDSYLEDICANLESSLLSESKIALVRDLEAAELHIHQAVPLGLIVNEVVTNAAKYAFAPGQTGEITVRFHTRGDRAVLTLSDNGRGATSPKPGVGTKLIKSLAQQIGARLRVITRNGFTYALSFQVPK